MNIRKAAGAFAAGGLVLGLLGSGIGASYLDSATAALNINVGTFSCQVSSTDSHAVISPDQHTVTFTLPTILSSTSGNSFVQDLTIKNAGSMAAAVNWTFVYGGTVQWSPASSDPTKGTFSFGVGTGNAGDATRMDTAFTLAAGASRTYGAGGNGVGFIWSTLGNGDFGDTAQVTATAHCGEVPPAPVSKIQFIGLASEAGHAALTLPAGAQPGDMAVVLEAGSAAVATPTGWTNIATPVAPRNATFYRVLVAGDTAVPAAATTVTDIEVAIYRGVSGVGSHTYYSGNSNNVGLSGGSGLYYPLGRQNATGASFGTPTDALDGVYGPAMTKTDGSSWVVLMGYDAYASTNMKLMGPFQTVTAPVTQQPAVLDGTVASGRSSGNSDAHTGLADTNGGVAAFLGGAWAGDNFPLPGTHGVALHTIELLSK